MFDPSRTSVVPNSAQADNAVASEANFTPVAVGATRALYATSAYLGGLSTQRTRESGYAMNGVPVSSCVINLLSDGIAGETYVYAAIDQVVTIDGSGNVSLIR